MYKNKLIISKLSILIMLLCSNMMWAENIPVTNRLVKKGSTIKQHDIIYIETNLQSPNIITSSHPLIGAFTLTDIKSNTPISEENIKSPNLVQRNAVVEVDYVHNNIKLSTKALALQSAPYGRTIKLKSIGNNKNIWGVVKGKNKVIISS